MQKKKTKNIMCKLPHIPNALTAKTIKDAHNGIGIGNPITNIEEYFKSL